MAPDAPGGRFPLGALFRLAWRNLARNRRRTAITATTVALGMTLLQLMMALLAGIERQSFRNLISYQTGNAKVYARGYFDARAELPLDRAVSDLEPLETALRSVDGIAAAAPRLTFQAQLSNGAEQLPAVGIGIASDGGDETVFNIRGAVVAGDYLPPAGDGLLMGSGLAKLFGAGPGDWLTLLSKTRSGAYEAVDLPVVGVVGTGNPAIDRRSFLLPLSTAQRILDMEGRVTEVAVRFEPLARESAELTRLAAAIPRAGGLEVRGWREEESDFMALVRAKRSGSVLMLAIFISLAMVGITNTILMAAYERTREIGMLMAMGMRRGGIRRLFLVEGALIGLLGSLAGTALALGVVGLLSRGIDIGALYGEVDIGYPVKDRVYPALVPAAVAAACLLATGLAAVASLYPAARASREHPAEALRSA